jgi:hypothetical protein
LRNLAQAFPQEQTVCELLGVGLFRTLVDAKQEETPEECDALRQELRILIQALPQHPTLREIGELLDSV